MNELFGIPVDTLLVVLLVGLVGSLCVLGALALRNRILVKLALRNVGRRRGRSALIVVGLMLGTTIIAAALATGDTMSHTIRSTAVPALGETDETIAPKGAVDDIPGELGAQPAPGWIPTSRTVARVRAAAAGSDLVDGVTGAIVEQVAVQAPAQRQNEPSVVLFAADPARMAGFSPIRGSDGARSRSPTCGPGEVYLNAKAARELRVEAGDRVVVYAGAAGPGAACATSSASTEPAPPTPPCFVSLAQAQRLYEPQGQVKARARLEPRRGRRRRRVCPTTSSRCFSRSSRSLGLEIQPLKADAIEDADAAGNAFMAFFTTFGTFSIAAGILLIFLIFVMLAAERRGELGIARAVGTRRGHLVQMFTFEGVAYDLARRARRRAARRARRARDGHVMASAFAAADADEGLQIEFAVSPRSLVIAFALGMLLTLVVVAVSAWRVSVMNVSTAIRNLPEPPTGRRRRRLVLAAVAILLGVAADVFGTELGDGDAAHARRLARPARPRPAAAVAGVSERIAYTALRARDRRDAHAALERLGRRLRHARDGLHDVDRRRADDHRRRRLDHGLTTPTVAARLVMRAFGRIRALAPVLRMSIAYPLAARFRTGTTLAMFTLVVFTLVTGTASNGSFVHAIGVDDFGGGFQVRAGTTGAAPIDDMAAALRRAPGRRRARLHGRRQPVGACGRGEAGRGRTSVRDLPRARARQRRSSSTRRSASAPWRAATTRSGGLGSRSRASPGSPSSTARSSRAATTGTSACCRTSSCPASTSRRGSTRSRSRSATSRREGGTTLTVIGILKDTAPLEMVGISTLAGDARECVPGPHPADDPLLRDSPRRRPGRHGCRPRVRVPRERAGGGVDPAGRRRRRRRKPHLQPLIQGFMGLGLIVGVAALGVISARAVVERRQQIGVMRAIGFRTRHGASRVPARVLVRRADLDPRRHRARPPPRVEHHPRPAIAAELGEPRARRALAEPRASSSWSSTPSPSLQRWRLRSAPRGSSPPKRCDISKRPPGRATASVVSRSPRRHRH